MATIRETILSYPGLSDCEAYLDNVVLQNRSVIGAEEYSPGIHKKQIALCAADLYAVVGNNPDFTENKLSILWSTVDYLKIAARLYRENGEPERADELVPKKRTIRLTGKAKYTS